MSKPSRIAFSSALVISPHPDDAEFGCGGAIAGWVSEGKDVILCVVTNGAMGSNDPSVRREDLIATREREQREAAAILGISQVIFLGYEDGYMEDSHELRRDLIREVRRHKPDLVLGPDPSSFYIDQRYVNHPDHRAVGQSFAATITPGATTVPLYRADLYDRGFEPHRVKACLLYATSTPDCFIEIGPFIETKVRALRAHRSQFGDAEDMEDRMRDWAKLAAEGSGQELEYAESFKAFFFDD
ncbi:MAG: PIG-L deacetylase family protein [Actinomycetota bacterium]